MEKNENDILKQLLILDNGGRRSGGDRRNYSYTLYIPERRSEKDRRGGNDRRKFSRAKEVVTKNLQALNQNHSAGLTLTHQSKP